MTCARLRVNLCTTADGLRGKETLSLWKGTLVRVELLTPSPQFSGLYLVRYEGYTFSLFGHNLAFCADPPTMWSWLLAGRDELGEPA